jgi:hypothetical protein
VGRRRERGKKEGPKRSAGSIDFNTGCSRQLSLTRTLVYSQYFCDPRLLRRVLRKWRPLSRRDDTIIDGVHEPMVV